MDRACVIFHHAVLVDVFHQLVIYYVQKDVPSQDIPLMSVPLSWVSPLTGRPGGPFIARLPLDRWTEAPPGKVVVGTCSFACCLSFPGISRASFNSPSLFFRGRPLPPVPPRPLPLDFHSIASAPSQRWLLQMNRPALSSPGDPRMRKWMCTPSDVVVL